jgi:hypothetical protein
MSLFVLLPMSMLHVHVNAACNVRSFGNIFDGIIHFTIQLHNDITLPHFINIEDKGGHLVERLFMFSD